ncbi:hypothetical protein COW36_23940 [bacterium (Candidatus Blackallbacteria) CG17_big_fil_post_rev_8_21_14_2_50_48_46]|uniref:Uncharacterized protein n=1 Tax=bacterium (Candidatus Blackallbacteria) CG17_big_fil_post_rev_8_21_14_2_50_48_46 TaxID=2014261 RepID=A0A2M7FX65_9BACT|nr:MAG: hypothetical protein COW64_18880 [bacterium (Candidatus Blackallbacteria) CG18_big_fil_WC_8_21_14_2_50_49_26]PIW13725.1 MAG: hypothetical protein COW36_23940 [bacterium (Candidatus Blackallbacteria) CG17_big_fil_post_rev_8_21_14_2_50_48_46]PIW44951.1 MAG: hypothetical protein COW20_21570 [bacterium (Candidatus Blackallbacteria) CG13_big_fil_rev_8_21_14_2_50_49_14]
MKARYWFGGSVLFIAVIGGTGLVLGPKWLMRNATQKPAEVTTFVSRPAAEPDLRSQMSQALQEPAEAATLPQSQEPNRIPQNTVPAQREEQRTAQQASVSDERLQAHTQAERSPQASVLPAEQNRTESRSETRAEIPPQSQPANESGKRNFQLNLSENQIASMIYNGLYTGTVPEYRPSIQGVSVQLQNGRGRITVALLPKYLPDHFFKNLPGVTRETPTIYLGGELGLSLNNQTISPEIYSLSLGSLKIPAPFIKAMVKHQVQQQVKQITQLESGQQAILDAVNLEQGNLTIQGHVE